MRRVAGWDDIGVAGEQQATAALSPHGEKIVDRIRAVAFETQAHFFSMCVDDDGRGGVSVDGNGLAGMRDRVRAMGGTLSIESPSGGGTKLLVRVGLPA